MNFYSILKQGYTVIINGTQKNTGAYFTMIDNTIYSYNKHIGYCKRSDLNRDKFNNHIIDMIIDGFIITIGADINTFKKELQRGY
jgi:hypothetical protein